MCKGVVGREEVAKVGPAGKDAPLPSIKDVRAAIPKHCFQRSLVKSLFFVARQTVFAGVVGYAAYKFLPTELSVLNSVFWVVYALVQGTILTGHWVQAHECGHYAFSDFSLANDLVGFVLHSALLVPYFR